MISVPNSVMNRYVLCRPQGENPEKSHRSHLPPLLCHPPFAGRLRHPRYSESARPLQLENHHDLHPLCAGKDHQGSPEPAGYLKAGG
jgi:hypothetical protein